MYDIIHAATENEDLLAIEVIEKIGEKLGRYLSLIVNVFNLIWLFLEEIWPLPGLISNYR
mgnify:CR=1 FL=1